MKLSEEERKLRRKESIQRYRNSEKGKETVKKYNQKKNEEQKEYRKKYYEENKETLKEKQKEVRRSPKYKENQKKKEEQKKYSKKYYEENKETIKEKQKIYYELNPDKKYDKKIKASKRRNDRRKNDSLYKLRGNISSLINFTIKSNGYKKDTKTFEILGCSLEQLREHLQNQFTDWMNWENYGTANNSNIEPNKTWDIDHIIPVSKASSREEVLLLNHYSNLQPLCSHYNRYVKKNNT